MKLRQYERKEICQKAIRHAYDEKITAHRDLQSVMFMKGWEALTPVEDRKLLAKVPTKYLRTSSTLVLNIDGMRIWLENRNPKTNLRESVVLANDHNEGLKGPVADEILAWYKKLDEVQKERDSIQRKLMALLESVTTLGKLQEVWPEGEQFYLYLIGTQATEVRSGLPAPLLTELNEKLGLNLPKATKKGKTNAK